MIFLDHCSGMLLDGLIIQNLFLCERLIVIVFDDQIVRNTEVHDKTGLLSVLRDKAQEGRVCNYPRNRFAINCDASAGRFTHTGNTLCQFFLAVAVNTCYSDNLTCVNRQVEILQCLDSAVIKGIDILHDQNRLLIRIIFTRFALNGYRTTNHHLGKGQLGSILGVYSSNIFAIADNRNPVCDLNYLTELVADKDNRTSLSGNMADRVTQLVTLGRGQNCGRLVQYQNLTVSVQSL